MQWLLKINKLTSIQQKLKARGKLKATRVRNRESEPKVVNKQELGSKVLESLKETVIKSLQILLFFILLLLCVYASFKIELKQVWVSIILSLGYIQKQGNWDACCEVWLTLLQYLYTPTLQEKPYTSFIHTHTHSLSYTHKNTQLRR